MNLAVMERPFAPEKNTHGHWLVSFEGLDLSGEKELQRLNALPFGLAPMEVTCLRSPLYEAQRITGPHTAVIVPVALYRPGEWDSGMFRERGTVWGYRPAPIGALLRLRERIPVRWMLNQGICEMIPLGQSLVEDHRSRVTLKVAAHPEYPVPGIVSHFEDVQRLDRSMAVVYVL